jgi:hypothetical protein
VLRGLVFWRSVFTFHCIIIVILCHKWICKEGSALLNAVHLLIFLYVYIVVIYIYIHICIFYIYYIDTKFSKQFTRHLYCVNSVKFMTHFIAPSSFLHCVICIRQDRTRSRITTDLLYTTLLSLGTVHVISVLLTK